LTILRNKVDKTERSLYSHHIDVHIPFPRFEMILLSLSALILGAGLQMQPQTAPVPAAAAPPVIEVIAITTLKPGISLPDLMKLAPEEVRGAVQLYLEGKIDQWYSRSDGKGVVLLLRCKTADEAKALLADLPLVKMGYLDVEYIPVGPFSGLRILTRPQPPGEGAAPH
jgi:hypothetical protein